MTPALIERLKMAKVELLHLLHTEVAVTELRQSVERLWKGPAWRSAWEQRFKAVDYANFDSLRRVLNIIIIDLAKEHHRRHDGKASRPVGIFIAWHPLRVEPHRVDPR
jgi:hypothetical protein